MNNKFSLLIIISVIFSLFASCGKDDKEMNPVVKQMTLIYAVDHNNLSSDLRTNEMQVKQALSQAAPGEYSVLIFRYIDSDSYGLYKLVSDRNATEKDAVLIKTYSSERLSTDPSMLSDVIKDAIAVDKAEVNNLFLWGHGTGWWPFFTPHVPATKSITPIQGNFPEVHSYGGENNGASTNWMEIDELASAIPDHCFETIWFDACYMSSIECVYQLRNKSKYMVAYPTEIYQWGLPYDKVLPYMMRNKQDLSAAAKALYDRYAPRYAVTVCVMDMSKINDVAMKAKKIYASGDGRPEEKGLQKYSRRLNDPVTGNRFDPCFYDFGQYVKEFAEANGRDDLKQEFHNVLNDFVMCKYSAGFDFNDKEIKEENFSGISTHYYKGGDNAVEEFYRKLDWYKAAYK